MRDRSVVDRGRSACIPKWDDRASVVDFAGAIEWAGEALDRARYPACSVLTRRRLFGAVVLLYPYLGPTRLTRPRTPLARLLPD